MPEGYVTFSLGVIAGGAVVIVYSFLRGYFQHFGTRAEGATLSLLLPGGDTELSEKDLQRLTLELHSDISEFQTRRDRERTRNFWDRSGEELDKEEILRKHKEQSVRRDEFKGEFLKKFAPRLEMILQEYEQRSIEPDDDMMEFDSIRWWAQHGETMRILPTLRHLAQKLDS